MQASSRFKHEITGLQLCFIGILILSNVPFETVMQIMFER